MPIVQDSPIQRRFIGKSTDVRPYVGVQTDGTTITKADLPAGSLLFLTDTWETERWDGNQWAKRTPDVDIAGRLDTLIAVNTECRDLLVTILAEIG